MVASRMRHCLDLSSWTMDQYLFFFTQIQRLQSKGFSAVTVSPTNRSVGLIFQEASTRTRISFEKAAYHLGRPSYLVEKNTSLSKGESLLDAVQTLCAMGIKDFVIRSDSDEVFDIAEVYDEGFVINAGSGATHHPTQGLLDAYTVWQSFGRLEGLSVAMIGDLAHSRVAKSNIQWMQACGIRPILCGPDEWLQGFDTDGMDIAKDMDQAIAGSDVIMLHRVQHERQAENKAFNKADFIGRYCMTVERLRQTKENSIVMHPGPMNRGIEIEDEVADHLRSKVLAQVANGVWIRMGLMQVLEESMGA